MQPSPLGDRQLGPDNAPVTIVEYASLTCPH
jgi:protein-disulfide isomerase